MVLAKKGEYETLKTISIIDLEKVFLVFLFSDLLDTRTRKKTRRVSLAVNPDRVYNNLRATKSVYRTF